MANEYIAIGRTKKTHGASGEIKVSIEDRYLDDFAQAEAVFIAVSGKPVPFFIEDLRMAGDLLLKLEGIDNPTDARPLLSCDIFLRQQDVSAQTDVEETLTDFQKLTGFEVRDESLGIIGKITQVVEYPQQEIAVVDYGGKEVLVPLHRHLIKEINEETCALTLALPDGILDL